MRAWHKKVYASLGIVYSKGRKRTLADKTVYQYGSIDASLDPPLFSLDSTFTVKKLTFLG
jgi:hypothetical protein